MQLYSPAPQPYVAPEAYTLPQQQKLGQPAYIQQINQNGERVFYQVMVPQQQQQQQQQRPQNLQFAPLPANQFLHQAPFSQPLQLRPAAPLQVRPQQPGAVAAAQQLGAGGIAGLSRPLPTQLPLQVHPPPLAQRAPQQQQPIFILTSNGSVQQVQQLQPHHLAPQPVTSIPLGARQLHHPQAPAPHLRPAPLGQPLLTSLPMATSIPLGTAGQMLQLGSSSSGGGPAHSIPLRPNARLPHPPAALQHPQHQQLAYASPSVSMQLMGASAPLGGQQAAGGGAPQILHIPPAHPHFAASQPALRPVGPLQLPANAISLARPPSGQQHGVAGPAGPLPHHQGGVFLQQHTPGPQRASADLKHLQQQLAAQQQQQQIASLRARVASLTGHHHRSSSGTPSAQHTSAGSSPALPPAPSSGSISPALLQSRPDPLTGVERVDQGLFLAQLVEQQQQQQQQHHHDHQNNQQQQQQQQHTRIGFGPRTSSGAPQPLVHHHAQGHPLPELRLHEEDDSVVFSEQLRPAPRNISAPALQHAHGSGQSPMNSAAASGGRSPAPLPSSEQQLQPPASQQQLKAASSDTNLQHMQDAGAAGAGHLQNDPAAAAAAAATAALAQPIHPHSALSNASSAGVLQPDAQLQQQQLQQGNDEAAGRGKDDLHSILSSIGVELARHGISVETAVGAGWLGVLSPADVKLLREAHLGEGRRLQLLHSLPANGGGDEALSDAVAAAVEATAPASAPLQPEGSAGTKSKLVAAAASEDCNGVGSAHEEHADSLPQQQEQLRPEQQQEQGQQREQEQQQLQKQLEAGDAERARLEEQLKAANPAQFSAFEYGFFAPAPGAAGGQSELMECLEDLNQGIFDATGLVGANKDQNGTLEQQMLGKDGPVTQPPSQAGGRDSDSEGPSDHELAARFANLDLGCGFF